MTARAVIGVLVAFCGLWPCQANQCQQPEKRRQIPVVVSQRRSQDNTLFLPDCVPCTTPTPPSSPDMSLCSTARPSRANLQNLIKVPLQSSDLPNQLCVCLFNAKSVGVVRKRTAIADFLADHDVDVMVLTETWLKESGDESKIADLTPPGYKLFSFPRQLTASIKGGGGIAVIMKDCLASHTSINTTLSFTHTSFEVAEILLTVQRQRLRAGKCSSDKTAIDRHEVCGIQAASCAITET
ncbi:hypothetical protein ACOMHN_008529 [Nucella lapillus]